MNGVFLTKTFINTFRNVDHLNHLLMLWERAFWKKHEQQMQANEVSATDLCFQFVYMIASCDMNLRYKNKYFFFQSNNDIIKISLSEFANTDYSIFLRRWTLMFKTKISYTDEHDEASDAENNEIINSEYRDCLHNDIVDMYFPRTQLVARYACLCLRNSVNLSSSCDYIEEMGDFMKLRNTFITVANKLLLLNNGQHIQLGTVLLDILYNRLERICFDWDPAVEVYPLYTNDLSY